MQPTKPPADSPADSPAPQYVWLWRHPPADAPAKQCLGWLDPPLADRDAARLDAEALAKRIGTAAAIYTSDLKRARQAARPLARRLSLDLQVTPALREINFGAWQGRDWDAIKRSHPAEWERYMTAWERATMPGGESYEELRSRVVEWWLTVPPTGHIVVVGHGGSLRALAAHLCQWTPREAIAMHLARGHFARLNRVEAHDPHWNLEPRGPFG